MDPDYQCYSQLLTYIQDPATTTTSTYPDTISTTTSQGDGGCLELELSGERTVLSNSDYLYIILQTDHDLLPTIISISI